MAKNTPSGKKVLTSTGGDLIVDSLLGQGATALVYHAKINDRDAVVKIAKPGAEEFIEGEKIVLQKAQEYYEQKQPSPALYASGKDDQHRPFIAMELLTGIPVLEVVLTLNARKSDADAISENAEIIASIAMPEVAVASLAVDFYRFLDFLHSELKMTYPDLKFDNLRLEKDIEGNYRLRLFDLGGLKRIQDSSDGIRRDIVLGASMLFALLKGYTVELVDGDLADDFDKVININSDDHSSRTAVSWGMRRFFAFLFSPVEGYQFKSAREAMEYAEELHNMWAVPDDELFRLITTYRDKAQGTSETNSDTRNALLTKARMGFEIYDRRFPSQASEKLANRSVDYFEGTSLLVGGKTELRNGLYEAAIRKFRAGETLEGKPTEFRRWRLLAEAMKQSGGVLTFEMVSEIADLFEGRQYQEVLHKTDRFSPMVVGKPIELEAKIYFAYSSGKTYQLQEKHANAIKEFRSAMADLDQVAISDRKSIVKYEGDPMKWIAKCELQMQGAQSRAEYLKLAQDLEAGFDLGKFDWKKIQRFVVLGKLEVDFSDKVERLMSAGLQGSGELSDVFIAVDLMYWGIPQKKTNRIRDLYQSCRCMQETFSLISLEQEDLRILKNLGALLDGSNDIRVRLSETFKSAVEGIQASGNQQFWEQMGVLCERLPESSSEKVKKISKTIEERIKEIRTSQQMSTEKMRTADTVNDLAGLNLFLFIQSLSNFDLKKLAGLKSEIGDLPAWSQSKVDLTQLDKRWAEVSGDKLLTGPVAYDLFNDMFNLLWQDTSNLVWAARFADIVSFINSSRVSGWNALLQGVAKDRKKLDIAFARFEKGTLDESVEILNSFSPCTMMLYDQFSLLRRIVETKKFIRWADDHMEDFANLSLVRDAWRKQLEDELESYQGLKIPAIYIKKYDIAGFLDRRNRPDLKKGLGLVDDKKQHAIPDRKPFGTVLASKYLYLGLLAVFVVTVLFIGGRVLIPFMKPTPTSTQIPTITSSPTPPPPTMTLIPSPTALPLSAFLVSDPENLVPRLPVAVLESWKLPPLSNCPDDPSQLCSSMDFPVGAGSYGVFLLYNNLKAPVLKIDLKSNDTTGNFSELLGPTNEIQIPDAGQIGIFLPPYPASWVWVNEIKLESPKTIRVQFSGLDVTSEMGKQLLEQDGQLVLVKLDQTQWDKLLSAQSLIDGYSLYAFADSSSLYEKDQDNKLKAVIGTPLPLEDFWSIDVVQVKAGIFWIPRLFQTGEYKILYYSDSPEREPQISSVSSLKISPADASSCVSGWCELGNFSIEKTPRYVAFSLNSPDGVSLIPVDTIFIYKKK